MARSGRESSIALSVQELYLGLIATLKWNEHYPLSPTMSGRLWYVSYYSVHER